jgi:hypothetical protein
MPALLKTHKKQIYDQIKKDYNLDPELFEVEDTENCFRLRYKELEFEFILPKQSYEEFLCEYTRFAPSFPRYQTSETKTLDYVCQYNFSGWLYGSVIKYLEEEKLDDPWAKPSIEEHAFDDTRFTPVEREVVKAQLDKVEEKILEMGSSEEVALQLKKFATELAEIKEELKTLKKKNWTRQFIGWGAQLVSYVGAHEPEKIEEIKSLINKFFEQFNQRLIS